MVGTEIVHCRFPFRQVNLGKGPIRGVCCLHFVTEKASLLHLVGRWIPVVWTIAGGQFRLLGLCGTTLDVIVVSVTVFLSSETEIISNFELGQLGSGCCSQLGP